MLNKGQTALEFLATYGFTFLIIALIMLFLILYVSLPSTILPTQCTFYNEFSCIDLSYVNSGTSNGSVLVLLASDMNPGVVNVSSFNAVIENIPSYEGYCTPNTIISGQKFYCVAKFNTTAISGEIYTGTLKMAANYCAGSPGNINDYNCTRSDAYTFAGAFKAEGSFANPPMFYQFKISTLANAIPTSNVLRADGTYYTYGQLPILQSYIPGTQHMFYYSPRISTTVANELYTYSHIDSTCGIISEGTFTVTQNCTITAIYVNTTYRVCTPPANLNGYNGSSCALGSFNFSATNGNANHANFSNADLENANMTGVNVNYGNLEYANLENAIITNVNFNYADLKHADLQYAIGTPTFFHESNLSYTSMENGTFTGSDFSRANLTYANMQYTNLAYSSFYRADLEYANLTGANTTGASFRGAYTFGCTGCP